MLTGSLHGAAADRAVRGSGGKEALPGPLEVRLERQPAAAGARIALAARRDGPEGAGARPRSSRVRPGPIAAKIVEEG